jgi:hypothetical protein
MKWIETQNIYEETHKGKNLFFLWMLLALGYGSKTKVKAEKMKCELCGRHSD